jgi:phosphatidylglycerol:prolipoprotein diacylglycerol transferase
MSSYFVHPNFDPVIFSLGQFEVSGVLFEPAVRWYGMMYLLGMFASMYLLRRFADRSGGSWTYDQVSDLIFHVFLGVIFGGRIGYVLFYNLDHFLADPTYLFAMSQGGMSFHGGLIGVILAFVYHAKTNQRTFFQVADAVAPTIPIGLGLGRLGNFINGELYGRVTDVPWAMIFPHADQLPRHPSQLYQFALEGVALFLLLQWYQAKKPPEAAISGLFLIGYGCGRCIVETVREPDSHIGLYLNFFTQGQLLSLPMIAFGVYIIKLGHYKTSKIKAKS